MADRRIIEFEDLLDKLLVEDNPDFLKEALRLLSSKLMEIEVTRLAGAGKGERCPADRKDYRNGYRPRAWDTRVGSLALQVPKLRKTPYVPSFLEPRRRGEKALLNVIQEAYVLGVSTRKVEDLLQAMGLERVSKSQVSRICGELDGVVQAFRTQPLAPGRHPYVWLDARYERVRVDGRVVSNAVVIAYGVRDTGEREVLGVDVGASEDGEFWKQFLRSLVERGLNGVQLVISDAHAGLKKAIQAVLGGAAWQRCRVHFMRNALARVSKKAQPLISATLKTIFAQPNQKRARKKAREVADALRRTHPKVAELLDEATEDVIAFMGFPQAHWRKIHSTNPIERLNREIKRRTAVVGIFPNQAAVIRLVGMLLIEQNEEWAISRRYLSQESMAQLYAAPIGDEDPAFLELGAAA
jgi:transposase-like protein